MTSERTQLLLSSARKLEFIKKAIDTINENLYSNELFKDDRVQLEYELDEDGDVMRYLITGTPLDFFQIGLRYGNLEEQDRAEKIRNILNQ
jgi:hypothetical protein